MFESICKNRYCNYEKSPTVNVSILTQFRHKAKRLQGQTTMGWGDGIHTLFRALEQSTSVLRAVSQYATIAQVPKVITLKLFNTTQHKQIAV